VIRHLARRFADARLLDIAGSLTFTTLLSLVPAVTLALAVLSVTPVGDPLLATLRNFITANLVPGQATRAALDQMAQFVTHASRFTVAGLVGLAITSLSLMYTIDSTFNDLWKVQRQRPLWRRLVVYLAALAFGPLLVGASLWLTTWVLTAPLRGVIDSHVRTTLLKASAVLFVVAAFTLLYRLVPACRVRWRHAITGGVIAGAGFEAMKSGFAGFVTHFGNYKAVYGAFAALPAFLLWIWLSWLVVLTGAVIAAALGAPQAPSARRRA
jgi:membrane protein